MIRRIFQFRETRVCDVMIPLIHIYAVRDDAPIEEAVALAAREKVSRVPVFQQRMYNIIGDRPRVRPPRRDPAAGAGAHHHASAALRAGESPARISSCA